MRQGLFAVVLAFCLAPFMAGAQDSARIALELNKLEPATGACRAYVVLQNGVDAAFQTLKLDLVMFDAEGVVAKRLALEAAPLPPSKTSLKVFDVAGMDCANIGRILLNDVLECVGSEGPRTDCLDLINVSARGELSLIK